MINTKSLKTLWNFTTAFKPQFNEKLELKIWPKIHSKKNILKQQTSLTNSLSLIFRKIERF